MELEGPAKGAYVCIACFFKYTSPSVTWSPPSDDTIKINVDAAFPEHSSGFWIGLVVRNGACECVWWSRKKIAVSATANG